MAKPYILFSDIPFQDITRYTELTRKWGRIENYFEATVSANTAVQLSLQLNYGPSFRISYPVVETRTSYCAGLSAAMKIAELYSV